MLFEKLTAYAPTATPFHMPGHKRNTHLSGYLDKLCAGLDITEIDGFDDLHAPDGILLDSMKEAALLWGSDEARFLVNGSTCGILSAVYALGTGGGRAVIARNAHKSLYHALELTGLSPVFVMPEFDAEHGAFLSVATESIEKALDNAPDAKFIMITSPTYEGVISDIGRICRIAHARSVPVIVDEAHGAHLDLQGVFPGGAVRAGADIVIQSIHKTLPGLTQTAIMHVSGGLIDRKSLWHALDIFETSSPSYLLMASLDGCVRLMRERGQKILAGVREELSVFFKKAEKLENLQIWKPEQCFLFDDMKILISGTRAGVSGQEIMELLRREHSVELEAAYPEYAVAMAGAGTTKAHLDTLLNALFETDALLSRKTDAKKYVCPQLPEPAMLFDEALISPFELVPVDKAAGRISAEYAWAYPPGIPVFAPGERMDESAVSVWKHLLESGIKTVTTRSKPGFLAVLKQNANKSL